MKKRIEIRQDWKRGFGSAPTGIKNWVKWSLVGFVVYVAVRFVCAFWGGILPMLAVLAVVVFLIRAVWCILGQCKNLRGKFINCYLCLQIHSLWS